ncbi:MAG TPA: muconolactone Delta-isomerase family protein [Streptosporangiaceae bacterium]
MLILVICRPAADADQVRFQHLLADERAALRRLQADGTLTQAWSPGRPGAVLMLEVSGPPEAATHLASLPLAAEGLITTEIIPLSPLEL